MNTYIELLQKRLDAENTFLGTGGRGGLRDRRIARRGAAPGDACFWLLVTIVRVLRSGGLGERGSGGELEWGSGRVGEWE